MDGNDAKGGTVAEGLIMASKREKMFNGKPMSHWKQQAHELVVSQLLTAANLDTRALPCKLARDRLMELALAEDAALVKKITSDRERTMANVSRVLGGLLTTRD